MLAQIGQEEVFFHTKNAYGIDRAKVKCDYYDYLQGDAAAKRAFQQEYMSQYSWADGTLAALLEAED